jgi:hypothetical protein
MHRPFVPLHRLLPLVLALVAGVAGAQAGDRNLLTGLTSSEVARIEGKDASVFFDSRAKTLTLTFRYTQGEPEVRIPVRDLGWPTDWSGYRAITYDFITTSLEALAVGFSDGNRERKVITEPLPGIRIRGVIPFDVFVQTEAMNPLLPLGYKIWPERLFTFERVEEIFFRMRFPNEPAQVTLYNLTLAEDVPDDDILDRKPLIDRYGQWIPENWPDKAHSDEQLRALWDRDRAVSTEYPFCELGGMRDRVLPATGFFRVERVDDRWILVDPHGHPFFSAGMDLVGWSQGSFATDVSGREFVYEELPPNGPAWLRPGRHVSFYAANIMRRFGERWEEKWTGHILDRLRSWGFNTIANWSDRELAVNSEMPYVLPLSGWTTEKVFPFPYDFPDVFSEEFERNVDAAARRQVEPLKDDANLIGWFVGNEPKWARPFGSLVPFADMVLEDPEDSATKRKLRELLAANPDRADEIKEEFLFTCGEKYFTTIREAIRRYDPNHLNLGIRFAGGADERWLRMSGMFDVFSINIYSPTFRPEPEAVARFAELSGLPVMIGEFTAAAPGRGLQGLFYYVHKVRDQTERGKAYRYYVEHAAADPNIIGAHWFQMVDDLPTGRPSDQERLNYGFINVIDLPYPDLVEAARETHRRLYDLVFGKTEPYGEKPRSN